MKVNSSVVVAFVVGAVVASLPYTLSSGRTLAQGAGPNQGQGQGFPPQQGGQSQGFPGQPGQGFPGQGQQGQFRQGGQMQMGGPMVSSMTISGNYLFAAAGDTIYKINIENMAIMGQAKLPQPRPQQFGQGGQGQGQGQNPPRGGQARGNGNGNGNGNIPPNNK